MKEPEFQSDPIPTIQDPWDNAPLRKKTSLLILLATVTGSLVGLLEASTGFHTWPYLLGIALTSLIIITIAKHRLFGPVEELLTHVTRDFNAQRPIRQRHIPLNRTDEIGQLANILQQLSVEAYRQRVLEKNLRLTLDQRVQTATQKATHKLKELALRDPLTNLANRRFLDESLEPLLISCRQASTDIIAIVIDLDNFKTVNDTLGHAVGDWLLKSIAQIIQANMRDCDFAIRLGGDEFILILPGAELTYAQSCMRNISAQFAQQTHNHLPPTLTVGISAGVQHWDHNSKITGTQLIDAADHRLYQAKHAGKGQTIGLTDDKTI